MPKRTENQSLFNLETSAKPRGPVECLGMTFENDEARREHFLGLLREGLEELHAKLGGVFLIPKYRGEGSQWKYLN